MTNLHFFQLADEPAVDNPDYDDTGCQCPPGDGKFLLEIEEGQAVLVHAACGKQPPANWGDWHDLVTMAPIPVSVEWDTDCDGSPWHGMDPCDCDHWVQVTATSVPEDVPTYADAKKRVRDLHEPVQHMGHTWCSECSVRRRTGPHTDEWVAFIPHPCPTIDALENKESTG